MPMRIFLRKQRLFTGTISDGKYRKEKKMCMRIIEVAKTGCFKTQLVKAHSN